MTRTLIAALLLGTAAPAAAQSVESYTRTPSGYVFARHDGANTLTLTLPSMATLSARLREADARGDAIPADVPATSVLSRAQALPRPVVDSLLVALENTAARARTRPLAAYAVSLLGEAAGKGADPQAMDRLLRVYRARRELRGHVVVAMSAVPERKRAAEFLGTLAVQRPETADFSTAPDDAVYVLSLMGNDGAAVLRKLHSERGVREPRARGRLERLARSGYQLRRP